MRVELRDVELMLALRNRINSCQLDQIEWQYNGVPVKVDAKLVDEWKFMGLSNFTFAETELLNDKNKTSNP